VSQLSSAGTVTLNGFTIPGVVTRRAETTVELGSGQSFMIGGLLNNNVANSTDKVPGVGALPIIGALFRSTGFQHEETELVIIVTPHLVRPVPAGALKIPTDRVGPPNEADLLLHGRTDTAVGGPVAPFVQPAPPPPPPAVVIPPPGGGGGGGGTAEKKPIGFEKDYGHVL
jgi:pilus assembly protein CpaC